jgi:hypothetical protein
MKVVQHLTSKGGWDNYPIVKQHHTVRHVKRIPVPPEGDGVRQVLVIYGKPRDDGVDER